MKARRFGRGSSVAILSGGTLVLAMVLGTQVIGQSGTKEVPANPEAGLTDAQRVAIHEAAHGANERYLLEFIARHGDPHVLPVVEVESYGSGPLTLSEAVAKAELIVEGKVLSVDYAVNPSGGLPLSIANVSVAKTIRGSDGNATVAVFQLGGPVAQDAGGGLAQLDIDPLILPGDHVVLLLTANGTTGSYRTVPGSGVFQVSPDNSVSVSDGSPFAKEVNGLSVDALLVQIAAN
jgi:hypothetical protein